MPPDRCRRELMIAVTRLNGTSFHINALLIETIEETPDTLITLTTGKKMLVLENAADVISSIQTYLRSIGDLFLSGLVASDISWPFIRYSACRIVVSASAGTPCPGTSAWKRARSGTRFLEHITLETERGSSPR